MTQQSPSLRIDRSWDEALFQTEALRPEYCAAALLTWTIEPPPIDAGVPAELVEIVSRVATSMGPVAFRLFFPEDLPSGIIRLPTLRLWWPIRVYQRLTRSWPADIAIASEVTSAEELFSQDWQLQGQTALVLSGVSASEETLGHLRRTRDWRSAAFPQDARLMIAPAVDGDGILLAARDAPAIDQALGLLLQACRDAGLAISHDAPIDTEPMEITVSHHVDASEPDALGFYEYHYEYDIYRFSLAGRTYVARAYVHEPERAAFLSCLEGTESRLITAQDLRNSLLVAAADHLRGLGKTVVERLSPSEGYMPLEVPSPLQR